MRTAALDQPRLHVIEDLQWADVASVLLLAHVGATIADMPLLVVATLRTGEPRRAQLERGDRGGPPLVHGVRHAAAARRGDIAALIRDAGMEADAELVSVVQARTGGNPLFVDRAPPRRVIDRRGRGRLAMVGRQRAGPGERISSLDRLRRLPAPVSDARGRRASVVGSGGRHRARSLRHMGRASEPLLELLDQARAAHLLDAAPPGGGSSATS